eukprot:TRINITY_DN686_c0_g1_i1.p1 TRINITY_DN686_c0_g1~~TRINITY_DN686_c0_g1_i1.p1  ORF type:complete len:221 (-),score=82.81 TRINITY_DN686_c0_g1_i1:74-637(-)
MDPAFVAQFDRSHPTFHGGDPTPVGMGGTKVPAGLEAQADWQSLPVQAEPSAPVSYGPEYDMVFAVRESLGVLKKALTDISPPIEALMKLKAKGDASAEAVAVESEKKKSAISALLALVENFPEGTEFAPKRDVIRSVAEQAQQDFESPESFMDFALLVRQHTSKIFNEQKALLERLKQIKKAAAKK